MPLELLLAEMTEPERRSLTAWAYLYDDLDLSGVKIPKSFSPLGVAVPSPLSDLEIFQFKEKFKGLHQGSDRDAYLAVEQELISRMVGAKYWRFPSLYSLIRPFGMASRDFVTRKCRYFQAVDKIFPQGRDRKGDALARKQEALSSLFQKEVSREVRDVLQCASTYPNRETEKLSEALAWTKELVKRSPAALRALVEEHTKKSESIPDWKPPLTPAQSDESYLNLVHAFFSRTLKELVDHKEREN